MQGALAEAHASGGSDSDVITVFVHELYPQFARARRLAGVCAEQKNERERWVYGREVGGDKRVPAAAMNVELSVVCIRGVGQHGRQ